jgi:hypothetical protein
MTWIEMAQILEGAQTTLEKNHPSIRNSHIDFDANQMIELLESIDEQYAEEIAEVLVKFSADFNFQHLRNNPEEIITGIYFRLAIGGRFCRLLHEMDSSFNANDDKEHAVIQHILINVWHEFYPAAIKML